jgi:deoxyribose-phosphate aldolase
MASLEQEINLAEFIDHSLLAPLATPEQVAQWCEEAEKFGFATVCVYPMHVRLAADLLYKKRPQVCVVIGFPTGATTAQVKQYEAQEAVEHGATELDVMMNLSWLREGKADLVHRELAEICEATGQTVKAILETALLTEAEKKLAVEICLDAGVAFVKTNTGWYGSATVDDVKLLKAASKDRLGIKAAGGIGTAELAIALIQAGATRLGTSRGVDLVRQQELIREPRGDNRKS